MVQRLREQYGVEDVGFAVQPITDCPHVPQQISKQVFIKDPCARCDESVENWQCLTCNIILCSRYRNSHMLKHFEQESDHSVCLSFSDLSVWCFSCNEYVANEVKKVVQIVAVLILSKTFANKKALEDIKLAAYRAKFGEDPPQAALVAESTSSACR